MRPNEFKWIQVNPSESRWIQMNPNESKWIQVSPSESKWIQVSPGESKWIQVSPSESSESKWIQIEYKWVQLSSSAPAWVKVSLNDKLANVNQPPFFPFSPKPPYHSQRGFIGIEFQGNFELLIYLSLHLVHRSDPFHSRCNCGKESKSSYCRTVQVCGTHRR